ncbi:MAG: GNAT family N-acetyltransferase [Sinomicrobium sp.]|nr:GNAT family N-acetyltransferase [Sinomicrobium sp.]
MNDNEIRIADYKPEYKPRYIAINEAWIKKDYVMEALDVEELHNPENFILKGGGAIIVALLGEQVVGTCALVNNGEGVYEMVKMGVDEKYRGYGIGRRLCTGIIEKARALGAVKIVLYSNTVYSGNAVALYRKFGFHEVPLGKTDWARADIKMEKAL